MSDDFGDRRDNSPSTRSFEEWLDQQAEQQGISREELFERLISSYWTLNEMVQLLDDSGNTSLADLHPENRSDDEDDGTVPTVGHARGNDTEDRSRDRRSDRRQEPDSDRRRDRERDRRREPREDRRREPRDRSSSRERVDPDRFAELRDRVDRLESELEAERERGQSLDGATEALANRLTELERDLEEVTSESESARESLSAEYEELADQLDDLKSALGKRQDQLASEQERIRSRLDAEFEDLETILEYLISQTDELDAAVADAESRYDEELSRLRWERNALQSLKRAAADHDVHAGECESCGGDIDLDLLTEPYCQECGELLTGIEVKGKWLLFSDVIVTTDEGTDGVASTPGDAGARGSAPRSSPPEADSTPPTAETDRPPRSRGAESAPRPEPDRLDAADSQPPGEGRNREARRRGGSDPGQRSGDGGERDPGTEGTDRTQDGSSFEFGDFGSGSDDPDDGDADPFGDLDALKRQERDDR